jgi:hypothetical protein
MQPAEARHLQGGVGLMDRLVPLLRVRRQRREHRPLDLAALERPLVQPLDLPVETQRRRAAGDQQQVGRLPAHHDLEPPLEPGRVLSGLGPAIGC